MSSALDFIGSLRSADKDPEESAKVLLTARGMPYYEDLLRSAKGNDPDVLSPDRLLQWAEWGGLEEPYDSVWLMKAKEWDLKVCGVKIACQDTFDPSLVMGKWLTRPAWSVLDIWENSLFYQSEEGEEYRGVLRALLETVDKAWDHGLIHDFTSFWGETAYEAAYDAGRSCMDYEDLITGRLEGGYATLAVANVVRKPSYNLKYVVSRACNSIMCARNATGVHSPICPEGIAFRKRWHDDWTWHVLEHIFRTDNALG